MIMMGHLASFSTSSYIMNPCIKLHLHLLLLLAAAYRQASTANLVCRRQYCRMLMLFTRILFQFVEKMLIASTTWQE